MGKLKKKIPPRLLITNEKQKVYPTRIWILLHFYSVVCQDMILMEDVLVIPNLWRKIFVFLTGKYYIFRCVALVI